MDDKLTYRNTRSNLMALVSISLGFFSLCSCNDTDSNAISEDVELLLKPSIICGSDISRAQPLVFTDGLTKNTNDIKTYDFGIWVGAKDTPFVPYSLGMANMRSTYESLSSTSPWTYQYGITNHKVLSVKPHAEIAIHAYYPYDALADVENGMIHVSSAVCDVLYATPLNITVGNAGTKEEVALSFHHALACIELSIEASHSISGVVLKKVEITDVSNGESDLYGSAELKITDGTFDNRSYSRALSVTDMSIVIPQKGYQSGPAKLYIPLVPTDKYNSGDWSLTFTFGWDKTTTTCTFPLPKIGEEGFKQGYKYIYNLTFSNESTFKVVGAGEWTEGPETRIDV